MQFEEAWFQSKKIMSHFNCITSTNTALRHSASLIEKLIEYVASNSSRKSMLVFHRKRFFIRPVYSMLLSYWNYSSMLVDCRLNGLPSNKTGLGTNYRNYKIIILVLWRFCEKQGNDKMESL